MDRSSANVPERLTWKRAPDGPGFRAFPDGDDKPYRYAAIWPDAGARHGQWRWLVRIDPPDRDPADFTAGRFLNGLEETSQWAANAANVAWQQLAAEGDGRTQSVK